MRGGCSFVISGRLFDVYVMLAFGLWDFLRGYGYPMAPLVLGVVLGDLLEKPASARCCCPMAT